MTLRGIITDWGGVLTTPLRDAIATWIEADDIEFAGYRDVTHHHDFLNGQTSAMAARN